MNLVQMSVSGAVMILVTVVFRSLFIHHLPKRTFLFMWSAVMVRLLIPFSLPCIFSAYSLFTRKAVADEIPQNVTATPLPDFFTESSADLPAAPANAPSAVPPIDPAIHPAIDPRTAVWLTGVLLCFVFFAASYVKFRMKFRESLPVDNEFINRWLAEKKIFRRISVRCSDRISAPLTYGVFRPVILLPKNFGQLGNDDLKFVLTHEYVHIRRFDAVFKLVLIAALCVHWFNPMVWVMFIIANRDIEISCDEAVIRMLGDREKQTYAMTLIRMEERKSGLATLNNSFSRSAIKERIIAIMKFKKATVLTVIASACLVAGTTTVFATSAQTQNNNDIPDEITSIADESKPDTSSASSTENSESEPTSGVENSESEPTSSAENSESEPVESSAEPVEEESISVEDWLKQPHSSPLANVNVELDPTGDYTFIPAEQGTEVFAIDDGEVVYAKTGFNKGCGAVVVIKHTGGIYTVYGHLDIDSGFEVSVGDSVKAGQCVGYVGSSGLADRHGLGFDCRKEMPNYDRLPGTIYYPDDTGPKQEPDDYDYIIPVDGIGFITGRYN